MNPQPAHSTTNFFTGLFLALILYFVIKGNHAKSLKSFDMLELGYSYDIPRQTYSQPLSYSVNFQDISPKKHKTKKRKKTSASASVKTFTEEVENTEELQSAEVKEVKEDKVEIIRSLAKDCYDTLVAIGYKKREAKKLVEEYFKKNPNPDITQFIKDITFKV